MNAQRDQTGQEKKLLLSKQLPNIVILFVLFLALLLPRIFALDRFATPDEPLWISRSGNFYYAITHKDFASTYQKEHPGVTVMWIGTIAYLLDFPEYRGSGVDQLKPNQTNYYLEKVAEVSPLKLLTTSRVLIVLTHCLLLLFAFLYAWQIFGREVAIFAFLLIAFEPFYLALTRVFHLDALLGNFLLLSLLALIHYFQHRKFLDFIVAGVALGFAGLTKATAILFIPSLIAIIVINAGYEIANNKHQKIKKILKEHILTLIGLGIIAAIVFVLFFPAMWVDPLEVISQIIIKATRMSKQGHNIPLFMNGNIVENGALGKEYYYFYPLLLLWRSTPSVLIGLLLAILGFIFHFPNTKIKETNKNLLYLLIFVIIYTILLTLPSKKFDRYLIGIFAPINIFAAFGWLSLYSWISIKFPQKERRNLLASIMVLAIGLQMIVSLPTYPYYFSYYNPIMGGPQKAQEKVQIGWGEGIDQAARYLNQKKNAKDLHVTSWYYLGCFSYFFHGHTRPMPMRSNWSSKEWQSFLTSDYAVIYIHQWQRNIPEPILEYVSQIKPEHTITINSLEYVQIYKIR